MKPSRARLYIDGFNFYYAIKKFCDGAKLHLGWCDFAELFRAHLAPGTDLVEIKYFTARVESRALEVEEDERARQELWLRATTTMPNLTLIEGFYQRGSSRELGRRLGVQHHAKCRDCPIKEKKRVEKQTDVNIAVHMIRDAALYHDYDKAILISADQDLRPAATAVAEWPTRKMTASVWFPLDDVALPNPKSLPPRIEYHRITEEMLATSRLPDIILTPAGLIECLDIWKKH
jgi:uncharacterized LabA/DUF88 family protein